MLKLIKKHFLLIVILLIGGFFRLYNLNWDQGFHLHPDERAIVLATIPLSLPESLSEFFTINSPLNPHFFAYGNFPMYFLKVLGSLGSLVNSSFADYRAINLIGRFFSSIFDLSTLLLLYFLGKKLFNRNVGLISAFFYSLSVLSIQSSHFYIVDIPLTFFVLLTLFNLVLFYEKPNALSSILVGFFWGISLATKTSSLVLIVSIGAAILADFLLIFLKSPHKVRIWVPHLSKVLKRLFGFGTIILFTAAFTFLVFEPYALIDFQNFLKQNFEQYRMTHDAFTFPYTLQYVGKTPYIYEIKNIFLWGLGPVLAASSFIGVFYFSRLAFKKEKKEKWAQEIILLSFFGTYFLVTGSFAIGFMRYLLPIYPLLCLFAAVFVYRLFSYLKVKFVPWYLLLVLLFIGSIFVWPFSFLNIYAKANNRVLSTEWISKNISKGNFLAIEHWDDGLPLYGQENYNMITLPLYEVDTPQKWEDINQKLRVANYIIIASNRLYTPLQKLTDCEKLSYYHCYPKTAKYYKDLFAGKSDFKKVAEFSVYPTIPILGIPIDDQSADESFTVYDHPKVIIFKNEKLR